MRDKVPVEFKGSYEFTVRTVTKEPDLSKFWAKYTPGVSDG
jgi:hypothetical protein